MMIITIKKKTDLEKTDFKDLNELRDFLGAEVATVDIKPEPISELPPRVRKAYKEFRSGSARRFTNM